MRRRRGGSTYRPRRSANRRCSRSTSTACRAACGCRRRGSRAAPCSSCCACTTRPTWPRGSSARTRSPTACSRRTSPRTSTAAASCPARPQRPPRGGGRRLRAGQHLAGARLGDRRRGAGRGDHAPRPPAARAREPRQPLRLDGDRGGAAPARARALRRASASRPRGRIRRAGDAGASGGRHTGGRDGAARAGDGAGPAGGARGDGRRRRPIGQATAWCCEPSGRRRTTSSRAGTATIERIYLDYDGRVHLAVTVDDDPGQDLLREMGRYLFFDPSEVVPA